MQEVFAAAKTLSDYDKIEGGMERQEAVEWSEELAEALRTVLYHLASLDVDLTDELDRLQGVNDDLEYDPCSDDPAHICGAGCEAIWKEDSE